MSETLDSGGVAVAAVLGWPIAQSKSPRLFDYWFRRYEVSGRYVPLAVRPKDFASLYDALPRAGLRGVNVTVPHKEQALALADDVSESARSIGAANMIVFDPDRGRIAHNTDGYGFMASLRAAAPEWLPTSAPALVLGAGGAARAVVHALGAAGVPQIRLANRTRDRAAALVDLAPTVEVVDWSDRSAAIDGAGLVVNTTSLGMTGKPPLEIDLDRLATGALVSDLVYAPLTTPLLADAAAHGGIAVDGLGMLLHQARPAFHAWFGVDPEVDVALREACLA
ncbi:MAG: shikimate dehydrogenase [Pseudomonadota bacterium]